MNVLVFRYSCKPVSDYKSTTHYDVVTYLYVWEVCFRYLNGNSPIELIEMDYQSHDTESLESGSVTMLWFGREHV